MPVPVFPPILRFRLLWMRTNGIYLIIGISPVHIPMPVLFCVRQEMTGSSAPSTTQVLPNVRFTGVWRSESIPVILWLGISPGWELSIRTIPDFVLYMNHLYQTFLRLMKSGMHGLPGILKPTGTGQNNRSYLESSQLVRSAVLMTVTPIFFMSRTFASWISLVCAPVASSTRIVS